MLTTLTETLKNQATPERAEAMARYFKTGKGEYAEGDIFIGCSMPQIRAVAKEFGQLPLTDSSTLLHSPIHEHRSVALSILVRQYQQAHTRLKAEIVEFYLAHTACINNWDLVDGSAYQILGHYTYTRDRDILDYLLETKHLWSERMAVVCTYYYIKKGDYDSTLRLCEALLNHPHDLMHKACGWMLREIAKRDIEVVREFLDEHHAAMPRTMLRYAIERFEPRERQYYLRLK